MPISLLPTLTPDPEGPTLALPASGGKSVPESALRVEGGFDDLVPALQKAGWEGREVDLVLPTEDALLIALRLPTRDLAEIESMVDLQSEEFSPFPPERTCRGWEVVGEHDTGLRVRLVLASLSRLQALRKQVEAAGLQIRRVDVDLLGFLHRLGQEYALPETGAGVVVRQGVGDLVVWSNGQIERMQHIGPLADFSREEVAEDVNIGLLGVEMEDPSPLKVWIQGDVPEWAEHALSENSWEVIRLEEESSASLHATIGALQRVADQVKFDIAPAQWEEERQARLKRKAFVRKLGGLAAIWCVLMAGLLGWGIYQEQQVSSIEQQVINRSGIVDEVGQMGTQVRSLASFIDRSTSALEVMCWLSRSMPDASGALEVTSLRYDKEQGVTFSGQAKGSQGAFLEFVDRLGEEEELKVHDYEWSERRDGGRTFEVETFWRWGNDEGHG